MAGGLQRGHEYSGPRPSVCAMLEATSTALHCTALSHLATALGKHLPRRKHLEGTAAWVILDHPIFVVPCRAVLCAIPPQTPKDNELSVCVCVCVCKCKCKCVPEVQCCNRERRDRADRVELHA